MCFFSCALRANSHDVHGLPRFRTNDVLLWHFGRRCAFFCGGLFISPGSARMEQLPGWNNYLGSILRLGWNNYLDGTTTWVRTCVLRPLGHSLYQLSYVEHLRLPQTQHRGSNPVPAWGASLDLQLGVRGLDRLQRECGLWTVGIACGVDVLLEVERLMSLALQEGETRTVE